MAHDRIGGYLSKYLSRESNNFAVLVNGEWGSGKTHYISNFLKKRFKKDRSFKFVYVSLAGVSSKFDFFERIFEAIMGIGVDSELSSSVASVLVDYGLDKALDGDEESVISGLFGMLSKHLVRSTKLKVREAGEKGISTFVFDDLERTTFDDYNELAGLVNKYVEHLSKNVILIANVDELSETNFGKVKEKIIGHEIKFRADVDAALGEVVSESLPKDIFGNDSERFSDIIRQALRKAVEAGFNRVNFRTISKVLTDISFIIEPSDLSESSDVLQDIFLDIYVLRYILVNEIVTEAELKKHADFNYFFEAGRSGGRQALDEDQEFKERINGWSFSDEILKAYCDYLGLGVAEGASKKIVKAYKEKKEALWRRLWAYSDLRTDRELSELRQEANQLIASGNAKIGEMLHIYGVEIKLAGGDSERVSKVIADCKEALSAASDDLIEEFVKSRGLQDSYGGHGYISYDSEAFKEIFVHLTQLVDEWQQKELDKVRDKLINAKSEDEIDWITRLLSPRVGEVQDFDLARTVNSNALFNEDLCKKMVPKFIEFSLRETYRFLTNLHNRNLSVSEAIKKEEIPNLKMMSENAAKKLRAESDDLNRLKANELEVFASGLSCSQEPESHIE